MHISFDFDYTLADSSGGTIACANYALERLGVPVCDPIEIASTVGLTLDRTLEELTGITNPEQAALFNRYFREHSEHVMLEHIHIFDVTGNLLTRLRSDGHFVSIVSTKKREHIEDALARDGLADLVNLVVGGRCVTRNKPHPEPLMAAVAASGVPLAQTVYVGDSVSDGECAARAGVPFIGVLSGKTSADALNEWHPQRLLAHVGELIPRGSDASFRVNNIDM